MAHMFVRKGMCDEPASLDYVDNIASDVLNFVKVILEGKDYDHRKELKEAVYRAKIEAYELALTRTRPDLA